MLNVLIAGLASGLLYGLLGFAIVVLYRMTRIANFAEGSLATLGAALVWDLVSKHGMPLGLAVPASIAVLGVFGVIVYLAVLRPRHDAGELNLTVRTLGLYLLLFSLTDKWLGEGQPFTFPQIFPVRSITVGPLRIAESSLVVAGTAVVLAAGFVALFSWTRAGLLLRGIGSDRDTARLLGASVRWLEALAWLLAAAVAAVAGILTAPTTLVSSDMMDSSLLYVFAGVVIGGLTSLGGAFIGGVTVGVVQGVAYFYGNADLSLLSVFALFLATLLIRPRGLFGQRVQERL
jgi:branched-chain amino acid transport system permease protein